MISKEALLNTSFFLPFDLAKWLAVDIVNRKGLELKGFEMYCGRQGCGKTIALSHRLETIREKYGDRIDIITNYGYKYQTKPFDTWLDLMQVKKKPTVYAIDEIQTYFSAREYQKFPMGLLSAITQTRKMVNNPVDKGILILCTSQIFANVDKLIRDQVHRVHDCSTYFGRLTVVKTYDAIDYQAKEQSVSSDKRSKIRFPSAQMFIQTDWLRSSYDTFSLISDMKNKLEKDKFVLRDVYASERTSPL